MLMSAKNKKLRRPYKIAVRFAFEQGWAACASRKYQTTDEGFMDSACSRYVSPKSKKSAKAKAEAAS